MNMKPFSLSLSFLLLAATAAAQTSVNISEGMCGNSLYYSVDADYQLAFWYDTIGNTVPSAFSVYDMWDFGAPDDMTAMPAPWTGYAAQIQSIDLSRVSNIGSNAFRGMTRLYCVTIHDAAMAGDSAFLGCTNLNTVKVWSSVKPSIQPTSLLLDKESGKEVSLVITRTEEMAELLRADSVWNAAGRVITTENGEWNSAQWDVTPSGSGEGTVSLTLDYTPDDPENPSDLLFIGDMDTSVVTPPWHELRDKVEEIVIGDKVSYVGKNAFASLTNVQSIQFRQGKHALDSIHIDAFAHTVTPWKFALGDPQDGPVVPPAVIGWDGDANSLPQNFLEGTVLYVPDSVFEYQGGTVRAIDLYRNDPFWSRFNRVTDRTVDVGEPDKQSVQMAWLPLEGAMGYNLTIHKKGCDGCDTTIFIPALGGKGLLDWEHMDIPSYTAAPRRKPKADDGNGGMTILIEIKKGSGSAPNNDVQVNASGLDPASEYSYTREVVLDRNNHADVNAALTKQGSFVTQKAIVYYTVTFEDSNGNIIKEETVEEGKSATAPEDELIPAIEGHTFTGWDRAFDVVEGDLTVTAQYELNLLSVTFVNWNGDVVYSQTVLWGFSADTPAGPSREGYIFTGWDKDYSSVKEDMVITAQFTILTFTVTFFDRSGNELSTQTVEWHGAAKAPEAPAMEGHTFTGWDVDFSDVTTDLIVMAQYKKNSYTVTFADWDGTVLSTQTVEWKDAAKYPADPTREGYTFVEWDTDFSHVTEDLVVTAIYTINVYTVTFADWDDKVLKTQEVEHESAATAPEDPTREGYTFTGWDKDFSSVTSDMLVTAQYVKNDPTGLDDVQKDEVPCTKVLREGRLVILVGGQEFDAQGKKIQ